jgi:hypothetical protein
MATGTGPEPAPQDGRVIRPVLWVICGAGRGVGKTRLALDLCRVLPDAAYAKQGTSRRRDEKPASYFRGDDELDAFLAAEMRAGRHHLVVESNALPRRGSGDIIIFLEAPTGGNLRGEPRADAGELREKAHVRMGRDPAAGVPGRGVGALDDGSRVASRAAEAETTPESEAAASDDRSRAASETAARDDLHEHLLRLGLDPAAMSAVIKVLQAQDAWNRGRKQS